MMKANIQEPALVNLSFEFETDEAAEKAAPIIEQWFKDSGVVEQVQARPEEMRSFPFAEVVEASGQIVSIVGVTAKVIGGVAAILKLIEKLRERQPHSQRLVRINLNVGNESIPIDKADEELALRMTTRGSLLPPKVQRRQRKKRT